MYVAIVSDVEITPETDDFEAIGPFDSKDSALDWAVKEGRYIVTIVPLTFRDNS
jgi:hypothetical protein